MEDLKKTLHVIKVQYPNKKYDNKLCTSYQIDTSILPMYGTRSIRNITLVPASDNNRVFIDFILMNDPKPELTIEENEFNGIKSYKFFINWKDEDGEVYTGQLKLKEKADSLIVQQILRDLNKQTIKTNPTIKTNSQTNVVNNNTKVKEQVVDVRKTV